MVVEEAGMVVIGAESEAENEAVEEKERVHLPNEMPRLAYHTEVRQRATL